MGDLIIGIGGTEWVIGERGHRCEFALCPGISPLENVVRVMGGASDCVHWQ